MGTFVQTLAQSVIHDYSLVPPIDLNYLCKQLDIMVKPLNIEAEAYLLCKNGSKQIIFNNSKNNHRIRFSIAHELGHYLIPWHDKVIYSCSKKDMKFSKTKDAELEANQFAAELLVPLDDLADFINQTGERICNFNSIMKVQRRYEVSLSTASICMINNFDADAAVVFSINGKIDWCYKGKYFYGIVDEKKLNSDSVAYSLLKSKNTEPCVRKITSGVWILDNPYERIIEESIAMPNINATLSILRWPEKD